MTDRHAHLDALASGRDAADDWNAAHPVGTLVNYWPGTRDETPRVARTRSTAWTLGHGAPVVAVHGYAGGIALDHVEPRDPAEPVPAVAVETLR